jgi:hypothetical protein
MTREDIIRMARESGFGDGYSVNEYKLKRFATLVADAEAKRIYEEGMVTVGHMREQILAEREACAKVCEKAIASIWEYSPEDVKQTGTNVCNNLAAAIRARSQP